MTSRATRYLAGLDIGSTTSRALVARVTLAPGASGPGTRTESVETVYESPTVFTPFIGADLDERGVASLVDGWLRTSGVDPSRIAGGGAILTGLAARASNAGAIRDALRARMKNAILATADDPHFESWLAFMGSAGDLSRLHPDRDFVNLDIGGGTTSVACGRAGEVLRTGSFFLGARHVEVTGEEYVPARVTEFASRMFTHLGIEPAPSRPLGAAAVDAFARFVAELLLAIVEGRAHEGLALVEDAPLPSMVWKEPPVVTFSGGVGDLVYAIAAGRDPGRAAFGDLGAEIARAVVASPVLARDLHRFVPQRAGLATVFGVTMHSTQLSGSTVFLTRPETLPLHDIPILGTLTPGCSGERYRALTAMAARRGGCVSVHLDGADPAPVRRVGELLRQAIEATDLSREPLVVLASPDCGRALGQYATDWGRLQVNLAVIDEVEARGARFVTLGAPCENLIPVSFHGMHPGGVP